MTLDLKMNNQEEDYLLLTSEEGIILKILGILDPLEGAEVVVEDPVDLASMVHHVEASEAVDTEEVPLMDLQALEQVEDLHLLTTIQTFVAVVVAAAVVVVAHPQEETSLGLPQVRLVMVILNIAWMKCRKIIKYNFQSFSN